MSKLPKTVFVYEEKNRYGEKYLMVTTDIYTIVGSGEKKSVGIYSLTEIKTVEGVVNILEGG